MPSPDPCLSATTAFLNSRARYPPLTSLPTLSLSLGQSFYTDSYVTPPTHSFIHPLLPLSLHFLWQLIPHTLNGHGNICTITKLNKRTKWKLEVTTFFHRLTHTHTHTHTHTDSHTHTSLTRPVIPASWPSSGVLQLETWGHRATSSAPAMDPVASWTSPTTPWLQEQNKRLANAHFTHLYLYCC